MADLITRVYSNFRGVDFRGEEINLMRSPDSLNVWKDYKETESIRTRPELAMEKGFAEPVHGIFFYDGSGEEEMIVHSGTKLYSIVKGDKILLYSDLNRAKSEGFIYNNIFFFKDGKHYLQYDGSGISEVVGYIPTTSIGRRPSGGGSIYEDVNLLSDYRYNTFLADGEATEFFLDSMNIDEDFLPEVTVYDEAVTDFEVDYALGKITFATAPEKPLTDGQDNVKIKFKKTIEGYRDKINKCTLLQLFDNRVFFSGNEDYPNMIFHCSLNDPTYCSDLDYYTEGLDSALIRGMVAGNNGLWVFKEPSLSNTSVFYHTPTTDAEYGKIYPSTHSNISTGCRGRAINFNDDIIFFSDRGMEGVHGDITTEQAIAHRSSLVDRRLTAEPHYTSMHLEEWDGYLLVFIDHKVYVADSRGVFTNEDHIEYEWFYWEIGKRVACSKVHNGILYLGTQDGVYTLTDLDKPVESYWITPKDKFKSPNKLKTSNKRGCVVEATGDISVYAKVEDTDFEIIGTYENISDYFVSRIKRKKFKDIQLKFYSKTRFSLETATLECFVGGYLKR